jgi:riboflavin synthase
MFTGLVEATGVLRARVATDRGQTLEIGSSLGVLEIGESIAVNGTCLTVTSSGPGSFAVDVSGETLAKTTLGGLALGAELNLERSLRLGDRLGGHLVSGHVDGVATIVASSPVGEALEVTVGFPRELAEYVAPKGSIVLDGVSLTVNAVAHARAELTVMLIPHTLKVTNLKKLAPGSLLNLEVDLLARYVVNFLRVTRPPASHA